MANNYFNKQDKSIIDYLKGAYHWMTSKPYLLGNNEDKVQPTTGTAGDLIGGPGGVVKAVGAAGKAAKATRAVKAAKATRAEKVAITNRTNAANRMKKLYQQLTPAERNNFDKSLKNVGRTLDMGNPSDESALLDIIRNRSGRAGSEWGTLPTEYIDGSYIKDTSSRWSSGTPTKYW